MRTALVVQRNDLSRLPQPLPPRLGVAFARPAVAALPPGRQVQRLLLRIPRRRGGQQHLQQPADVRQRDPVRRFFPPTAGSPASRTTSPTSPASCGGATPTSRAPRRRPAPV